MKTIIKITLILLLPFAAFSQIEIYKGPPTTQTQVIKHTTPSKEANVIVQEAVKVTPAATKEANVIVQEAVKVTPAATKEVEVIVKETVKTTPAATKEIKEANVIQQRRQKPALSQKPKYMTTVHISGLALKNSNGKNADDLDDIYGEITAEIVDDENNIMTEQRLMFVRCDKATIDMEETPIYEIPCDFGAGHYSEKMRAIRLRIRLLDKDANCDWGGPDGDDDSFFFVNETVTDINSGGITKIIPISTIKKEVSTVEARLYNGSDFLTVCINVRRSDVKI